MTKYYDTKIEGFKIRYANESDVSLILKFIKELADYEGLLNEVVATEEILMESLFEKKQAQVIIGEYNGQPAGFALFFHNFSTFLGRANLYLEDLYVDPAFRGKGLGKTMLACLGTIAVERGCGRLDWWCLDWNKTSIDFYLQMGAKPMDEWTVYRVDGENLPKLAQMM
ncbi:GNAT family N-acetyltransferase [Proteocatella sphenisci]|uniref:GNAT family N-acetyltransferase n=1 Tax=Proteocatella sphenisci TaxID=181070 RepID=UPI00048BAF1D|nr:GNAT family N-acetyltransferase [Proteocatella sphenisci]